MIRHPAPVCTCTGRISMFACLKSPVVTLSTAISKRGHSDLLFGRDTPSPKMHQLTKFISPTPHRMQDMIRTRFESV